ncbi:MAG: peptidylprolyl isomerase, partial [Candidatus Zixiibacteriota bacterium]
LAFDYSLDPSAKRNRGDLGYFTWGTMVQEFQEAAFNMEPGQVSPPVATQFGYHIIKLVDKQPNDLRDDYKTIKKSLEEQIKNQKIAKLMEEYFQELKEKYNIQIEQATCDYIMHKRENLYPPQVLQNLPRYDFDLEQLDRSERELILATWEGGQMTLYEYLSTIKQYPVNVRPDLDNYDSLRTLVFIMKSTDILAYEATSLGLDNDSEFKRKMKLFKEFNMAAIMRSDSIQVAEPPEEMELREYYEKNHDEFIVPPKLHVYEILLSDELLARKLAKEIKSLAKFKEKAMELTERSGKRGSNGDLGIIERKWFPEIFDLARKTPVGNIGGPVVTQGKYSIFYVADKEDEKLKDFLEVKTEITTRITDERKKEAFANWVEERKKTTKVETFEDVLWSAIDIDKYGATDTTKPSGE